MAHKKGNEQLTDIFFILLITLYRVCFFHDLTLNCCNLRVLITIDHGRWLSQSLPTDGSFFSHYFSMESLSSSGLGKAQETPLSLKRNHDQVPGKAILANLRG